MAVQKDVLFINFLDNQKWGQGHYESKRPFPIIHFHHVEQKAAQRTTKIPLKFFKGHSVWSSRLRNLATDVSRSCTLPVLTSDLENWAENIHACVLAENTREYLFHDHRTTLSVAHMGKVPYHTVKMLPDGLHILLLPDSVVTG